MTDIRNFEEDDYKNENKRQILKVARSVPKFFRSYHAARFTGTLVDAAIKDNQQQRFDCSKGCSWCCSIPPDITAGEAFVLAKAVRDMPSEKRDETIARFRENVARMADTSPNEQYQSQIPCGFLDLDQRACSVYESRPATCRRWHSLDAEKCRLAVDDPDISVPLDPKPMSAASLVMDAYLIAMKEPVGELQQGVLMAIEPDSEKRFARGEPIFEGWTMLRDRMTPEDIEEARRIAEEMHHGTAMNSIG